MKDDVQSEITREMLTMPMTNFAAQRENRPMTAEQREEIERIVKAVAETDANEIGKCQPVAVDQRELTPEEDRLIQQALFDSTTPAYEIAPVASPQGLREALEAARKRIVELDRRPMATVAGIDCNAHPSTLTLAQIDAALASPQGPSEAEVMNAMRAFWNTWPSFRDWWSSVSNGYGRNFGFDDLPPEPFETAIRSLSTPSGEE